MVDFYSEIPIAIIYPIGGIILIAILWSILRDMARADPKTRTMLFTVCFGLVVASVLLVAAINYFNLSEKLFPSFYEHEEIRQRLDNPWNLNDFQKPF